MMSRWLRIPERLNKYKFTDACTIIQIKSNTIDRIRLKKNKFHIIFIEISKQNNREDTDINQSIIEMMFMKTNNEL